jgi:hypothetical protein
MQRTYIRMGEKLVRIRQPDHNDDAARRVAREKGCDPKPRNESGRAECRDDKGPASGPEGEVFSLDIPFYRTCPISAALAHKRSEFHIG